LGHVIIFTKETTICRKPFYTLRNSFNKMKNQVAKGTVAKGTKANLLWNQNDGLPSLTENTVYR